MRGTRKETEMRAKDEFTRTWIIKNSVEIAEEYDLGVLTIRGLHYRLVARGMTNTLQHYKRVVAAMEKARWDGTIAFETFSDHDRGMEGHTNAEETNLEDEIDTAKSQIENWMENYSRNRWENQKYYPELFIEKKALLGVFGPVCREHSIALGACKGYPSLTFLNDAQRRFQEAADRGQDPIILYFGDYDPSGEDIPRSIGDNLQRFGVDVEVRRIALLEDQVIEWGLPPAPVKSGDSRTAKWDGLGQVELDAVEPHKLQELCASAITEVFDGDAHQELLDKESEEREQYRSELKIFVENI